MANPLLGQVEVRVGDRTLVLNFTVDAIIQLQHALGMSTVQIGTVIGGGSGTLTLEFLRTWLWAGLLKHQRTANGRPEFDEVTAGELMREDGGEVLGMKLVEAWSVSWPIIRPAEATDAAAHPPKRPRKTAPAGTGSTSSVSGVSSRVGRRIRSGS